MSVFENLIGQKFGRLTVLERDCFRPKGSRTYWICKCDCGTYNSVLAKHLKSGATKSCGCLTKETASKNFSKHNLSDSRLHSIWSNMKRRCYSIDNQAYRNYGGRGITVCDEWLGKDGFINFYNWAMENGYSDELTIDRINVNGNYCPENCRWATPKEQANNTRQNRIITFNNESYTMAEWADILKMEYHQLAWRINNGWSIERAFTEPIN